MRIALAVLSLLAVSIGSSLRAEPGAGILGPAEAETGPPTKVLDAAMAQRLRRNKGLTLQWISWDRRGPVTVTVDSGRRWLLRGEQAQADGPGRLYMHGKVTEIGRDYFLFDGTIRMTDTPDRGRHCEQHKVWRFAITQNRRYWRMREFEWCDDLTDYVDIYF